MTKPTLPDSHIDCPHRAEQCAGCACEACTEKQTLDLRTDEDEAYISARLRLDEVVNDEHANYKPAWIALAYLIGHPAAGRAMTAMLREVAHA